jgi:pSer/pThr/pTyr-binding forkhead associated (FHA) protein
VLRYPFALVGRDPQVDMVVRDAQVSRRHAFLHAIAARVFVVDLNSRTKVYWEGEDTPRSRGWLDLDHFVQIGPYRFRRSSRDAGPFDDGESQSWLAAPDQRPYDAEPALRASLELPIRVGDGPSLWPIEGELALVGRSELCQLVLTEDSISRFHAALVPTPSGVWVVDLLAREGVHVNGQRVRWAWIADGDTLRMGRFTFILRYETIPGGITRQDVPLEAGAGPAEQPGTELAVREERSDNRQNSLAVRSRGRPRALVRAETPQPSIVPESLVSSGAEVWQSAPSALDPLAMWQQQMQLMESFHNDMIMMVQMFVAMHKELSSSVRHELDMVQKLTRELSALQARTRQSPDSPDLGAFASTDRRARIDGPAPSADHKKRSRKPAADQAVDGSEPAEESATESVSRPRLADRRTSYAHNSPPAASSTTRAEGNQQVHAFLTERIAQLQRERQGYWQRILSTINK